MRRRWWLYGLKMVLFVLVAVAVVGAAVMLLWNWLMPALFGWPTLDFLQAVGLLVLSKILLGGLRGGWAIVATGAAACWSVGSRCRTRNATSFAPRCGTIITAAASRRVSRWFERRDPSWMRASTPRRKSRVQVSRRKSGPDLRRDDHRVPLGFDVLVAIQILDKVRRDLLHAKHLGGTPAPLAVHHHVAFVRRP